MIVNFSQVTLNLCSLLILDYGWGLIIICATSMVTIPATIAPMSVLEATAWKRNVERGKIDDKDR